MIFDVFNPGLGRTNVSQTRNTFRGAPKKVNGGYDRYAEFERYADDSSDSEDDEEDMKRVTQMRNAIRLQELVNRAILGFGRRREQRIVKRTYYQYHIHKHLPVIVE